MARETRTREKVSQGAVAQNVDGNFQIKIINAGWGSSGYYSPEVIENDGPKAFPVGTHMYFDHPSAEEEWNRPERSVRDILGSIVSTPTFEKATGSLLANVKVFPAYADLFREMMGVAGMSISAMANSEWGEQAGQEGPIITQLLPNVFNSVDLVTHAGRGGEIVAAFESRTFGKADIPVLRELKLPVPSGPEPAKKGHVMADLSEETAKSLQGALEALTGAMTAQTQAAETARKAAESAEPSPAQVALALVERITEAKLSVKAAKFVTKQVAAGATAEDAIAEVKDLLGDAANATEAAAPVHGKVTESGSAGTGAADLLARIQRRAESA